MRFFRSLWRQRDQPVAAASLPDPATLTADSDITPFLAPGVPQAVQARALRMAWKSDPRIGAFRGMADYDWDFNAEGYGRLALTDDVASLVQRIISPAPAVPAPETIAQIEAPPQVVEEIVADDPPAPPTPSRHGGALPA